MKKLYLCLSLIMAICNDITAQGTGTADDPIVANSIVDVRNVANDGKWMLLDLAGTQVSMKTGNDVFIQDATMALVFTKTEMRNQVSTGDRITAGKIKLLCSKHGKTTWVNGTNNDIVIVENIVKEEGMLDATELTKEQFTEENWGRYVKVRGKVVSEDNGKGGFNYYINEAGVKANRIMANYCGTTIPAVSDNGKEYYIYGILLSDFFRGSSFEEILSLSITDKKYTTYVTPCAVDFGNEVKAYIVNEVTADKVKTTQINNAPKDTPVIVYAENAGTYTLTETGTVTDDVTSNKLLASDGTVKGGNNIYAMAVKSKGAGFYKVAETVTIPKGKAYLVWENAPVNNAREFIPMGGGTTSITNITDEDSNARKVYYNLNGMRVDNPQKGIYIVNGKKVIF